MVKRKKILFVVDGNWYLHRCAHTTKTKYDFGKKLISNFLSLLFKDALAIRATHIVVAFDGPKVFRHKVFKGYKANRGETKQKGGKVVVVQDDDEEGHDLYQYYPQLFEALAKVGVSFYQPTKYEADDCLCSCAHAVMNTSYFDAFVGGAQDKDAFQYLLKKHVRLYDSSAKGKDGKPKPRYIDADYVVAKFGVKPRQMVDYQTLIGDKIDNLDGLPGYGPKTAAAKLKEWGSLKKWHEGASKADKRFLAEHQAKLVRNRKIVRLVPDVLPPFDLRQTEVSKVTKVKNLSASYHEYMNFLYPKSKGLAGLIGK
ncbi:ribonuclease H [Burkholderia phage BCSR5]|nr:ribonuclease H [Burkholderia phage BCSR5]